MITEASDSPLMETVERLFADLAAMDTNSPTEEDAGAWSAVEEAGIPLLLVPERAGGVEGNWCDLQRVVRRAAYHTLPLPIGETAAVCGLLTRSGLGPIAGMATIALSDSAVPVSAENPSGVRFSGKLTEVPWGRQAGHVLVQLKGAATCLLVRTGDASSITPGTNIAGEPRDTLVFDRVPATIVPLEQPNLFALGAFLRSAQAGGALERALELCVRHVDERRQFGRKLREFQAIQQQLAVLVEEAAAVSCATLAAAHALEFGDAGFEIVAAKLRTNLAIERGTPIAHQCHGAIGVTREYPLQRSTRRLWSWRAEFGNDNYLSGWLANYVLNGDAGGLWAELTERSDRLGRKNSEISMRY
jgi:acyl-CoA dehydrogenase